jgi:hypothetical protein
LIFVKKDYLFAFVFQKNDRSRKTAPERFFLSDNLHENKGRQSIFCGFWAECAPAAQTFGKELKNMHFCKKNVEKPLTFRKLCDKIYSNTIRALGAHRERGV